MLSPEDVISLLRTLRELGAERVGLNDGARENGAPRETIGK